MFSDTDISLDCRTCVAANTTACQDCVVQHLLANDDGPIEFVPVAPPASSPVSSPAVDPIERAVALFAGAGLIDDSAGFVEWSEFESERVHEMTV